MGSTQPIWINLTFTFAFLASNNLFLTFWQKSIIDIYVYMYGIVLVRISGA